MHQVQNRYKDDIRKKLRNQSYMRATVGVINQLAQENITVPDHDNYSELSNFEKPFSSYELEAYYAAAEENFTKVDGSMYFAPATVDETALNQGIVSKHILGSFRVAFNHAYDFRGITINFGEYYPVDFDIISDNETFHITNNSFANFRFEEVISNTQNITITPIRMVNGRGRLRILQFTCGIGIIFTNKEIIDSSLKQYINPLSEQLPTIDFSLNVDNRGRIFDIENDRSTVNFLEVGQTVTAEYGYQLDNNEIEWIKCATLHLTNWKADDQNMSFNAEDAFSKMNGKYYKGTYDGQEHTLYDLAVDVFTDLGFDSRQYEIDSYLRSISTKNPIPLVKHSEALQLIANAGRCIINCASDGKIVIKHSFAAQRMPNREATTERQHELSSVENITNTFPKYHYAIANRDLIDSSNQFYFMPADTNGKLATGYISSSIADTQGNFSAKEAVLITLEASYHAYGLSLDFFGNAPVRVRFKTYMDGTLVDTFEDDVTDKHYRTEHEFTEFNQMEIEFVKGVAGNYVYLDSITYGDVTDYNLTYSNELTGYPRGNQTELIKQIDQKITSLSDGERNKQILQGDLLITVGENNIFIPTWDNPFTNATIQVTSEMAGVTVSASTADIYSYGGEFIITATGAQAGTTINVKYTIYGDELISNVTNIIYEINTDGETVYEKNPLIDTQSLAQSVSEWEGDYYFGNREYEISYRGDPRIEANDILLLENKYTNNLFIRVIDHEIKFNGALSGSISARRDMIKQNA